MVAVSRTGFRKCVRLSVFVPILIVRLLANLRSEEENVFSSVLLDVPMSDKLAVRLVQRGILNARRLALG